MTTIRVSLADLPGRIAADMTAREKRVKGAIAKTAEQGAKEARRNVPVAFKELQDSVHATDTRIVADAPHAEPVEKGSRPHWVPLAPLIRWVKLRGMQGLGSPKAIKRLPGTTTERHARTVAEQLRAMRRRGIRGESGAHTPVDAPEKIARAIQAAIAKNGTRPTWFMMKTLPTVQTILHYEIESALPDKG